MRDPTTPARTGPAIRLIEHRLRRLASELARDVDRAAFPGWKLGLLLQLRDLQAELLKQFDREEENGLVAELLRLAPHWAHRIRQVEGEHRIIATAMMQLVAQVKRLEWPADARRERVGEQVAALVEQVRAHEYAECELMQGAYYEDHGAGD